MDSLTIHQAIKYLEIMLHFINFYQRNNRTQRLPSDPKPVKEVVPKDSIYFGKDSSMRIKALTTIKKELLMISCLLIAAKFNERDENLVKINELQKECKYTFTFKNITSCEAKILQELRWSMLIQTPLHYVKLFYSTGVVFASDTFFDDISKVQIQLDNRSDENSALVSECLRSIRMYCDHFADLSTLDYYMLQFEESVIALSIIICARKQSKVEPEYSEHFQKLYGILEKDVKPAYERLWKFYQECNTDSGTKDTASISPVKPKESRGLLRDKRNDCETPTSDTKKSISLMPTKIKTNKISFSDLETPQEKRKPVELRSKIANAQCFSDLHPIVEESAKKKKLDKTAEDETIPQETNQSKGKEDISKAIHRAVKNKKLGFYKASSQMWDSDSPTNSKNLLSRRISVTHRNEEKSVVVTRLKWRLGTQPDTCHIEEVDEDKVTEKRVKAKDKAEGETEARIPNQMKPGEGRENKSNNKSARRNRKERLKSAHSSQRLDQTEPKEVKQKPKSFAMKNTACKVIPKVYGCSNESFQNQNKGSGKTKIKDMLSQIDNVDLNTSSTVKSQVPFPNRKEYTVNRVESYASYGPLLTSKPIMGKGSFIETDNSKLQVENSMSQNHLKVATAGIDTRNRLNAWSSTSNYYLGSGLSCKNTTISDKNSEQDRVQRLEQEAQEYFACEDNSAKKYVKYSKLTFL